MSKSSVISSRRGSIVIKARSLARSAVAKNILLLKQPWVWPIVAAILLATIGWTRMHSGGGISPGLRFKQTLPRPPGDGRLDATLAGSSSQDEARDRQADTAKDKANCLTFTPQSTPEHGCRLPGWDCFAPSVHGAKGSHAMVAKKCRVTAISPTQQSSPACCTSPRSETWGPTARQTSCHGVGQPS